MIQKYIENPLILNRRKFDIRQWVLVTDWNPLTVWIYDQCYIRLAIKEYDPKTKDNYAHLTNNCVVKEYLESNGKTRNRPEGKSVSRGKDTQAEESEEEIDEIPENIWSL